MMSFQTKEWLSGKGTVLFLVFFVFSLFSLLGPTREEEMNAATPESCRVVETDAILILYRPLAARARRDRDREIGAALVRDHPATP